MKLDSVIFSVKIFFDAGYKRMSSATLYLSGKVVVLCVITKTGAYYLGTYSPSARFDWISMGLGSPEEQK